MRDKFTEEENNIVAKLEVYMVLLYQCMTYN